MQKVGLYSSGCLDVNFPNCVNENRSASHGSLYNKVEELKESVEYIWCPIVVGLSLCGGGCCRKEEMLVQKVGLYSSGCLQGEVPQLCE